jgi:hypothetical protein
MKYLKSYNESLRELMTPKSEGEIMKSLKGLNNSELLRKSIDNGFIKGIELALQNELSIADIDLIKYTIFYIKNKEIIGLLLEKIKAKLTDDQIYILEKYKLGLHQDEEKTYEIWFKTMLVNLKVSRLMENSNELIYKKDGVVLYNYNLKTKIFLVDYDKIWIVFKSKFHLDYEEIILLTKYMIEKHLNLKGITTFWGSYHTNTEM